MLLGKFPLSAVAPGNDGQRLFKVLVRTVRRYQAECRQSRYSYMLIRGAPPGGPISPSATGRGDEASTKTMQDIVNSGNLVLLSDHSLHPEITRSHANGRSVRLFVELTAPRAPSRRLGC